MTDFWETDEKFTAIVAYLPDGTPLPDPPKQTLALTTGTNGTSSSTNGTNNGNTDSTVGETTTTTEESGGGEKKLSKSQLKKMEKNKAKPKKEKPTWNQPKAAAEKKTASAAGKVALTKVEFVNTTPKGQKKDLSTININDGYQPSAVEAAWQDWWEQSGFYTCEPSFAMNKSPEEKFVMVIPPPNVTGSLHLGHALTSAVEDTLTRWHRMKGHATLYVPGIDHAGIATQSVVEKMLVKNENKNRHDYGRIEFTKKVWEWKQLYGDRITNQIRCLGSSVDWTRERFTMDEMCSKAVVEAFNRLYEDGLLYRAERLGNWSCALKSAISDIEVDYIELEGRTYLDVKTHTKGNPNDPQGRYEFGTLTSFAYPIEDTTDEYLVVATTRLETMLGDTAVAIHPKDPRYTHLHGKYVIHPFHNRRIPIICDEVLVDMEFGTGAVKITPAHDPNDYECGKRHQLEFITMLEPDGSINEKGGAPFTGMMRYDARIAIEDALKEKGLFRGKEPNKMRLGICSRSGDILEPMITPQWYVNCSTMAKRSTDAVRNKELKIIPEEHEKTWYQWLDNIHDWCISRQLWWGHQIPAWFATTVHEHENHTISQNDMTHNSRWIVARTEELAYEKAYTLLNCTTKEEIVLVRDEDVLDTWFSSGLFPFSVMGWPDDTPDMKAFYPNSVLETGLDILFFWVARMVMLGLQLTNTLPFTTVFLHAMVRDKEGRKMSKSLGNVIDPLEVIYGCTLESLQQRLEGGNLPSKEIERAKQNNAIEFPEGIPECGSDALRFGLLAYTVQGRDINLDLKRVVGYRMFGNKLWNATRFAIQILTDFVPTPTLLQDAMNDQTKMAVRDQYIITRLMKTIENVNDNLTNYKFGDAQQAIYSFWMDDVCDIYLELIKPIVYNDNANQKESRWYAQATLWITIETGLRLLHPMMPFVTEELWQRLPGRGTLGPTESPSIMIAPYPELISSYCNESSETSMSSTMKVIRACRSLRASYNIPLKVLTHFYIKISSPSCEQHIRNQLLDIQTLGKASIVDINPEIDYSTAIVGTVIVDDTMTVLMNVKGLVDYAVEIQRLQKNLSSTIPVLEQLEKKIKAEGYEKNVPDELKRSNQEKVDALLKKKMDLVEAIANLEQLQALDTKE